MNDLLYDQFENNGLGENSKILEMFKKKNKKVRAIFLDNEDDQEILGVRQSHGLRLESIHVSVDAPRSTTSDKENTAASSQHSSGHMQTLSPKSVHEARREEITDARPQTRLTNKTRRSELRRSLFESKRVAESELTCSTPVVSSHRVSSFKDSFIADDNVYISPIRYNHLNGIELIEKQSQPKTPASVQQFNRVEALSNIEKDLREQYQVANEPQTPKRKQNGSFRSEPAKSPRQLSATKSLPPRRPSVAGLTLTKTNQCSVVLEPMEMSEDLVRTYQQSRMKRLSVSHCNKTNMQLLDVNETPIAATNNRLALCDEELAKKLQICDSNITSDEDEEPNEAIVPQVTSPVQNVTFRKPTTPQTGDNVSMRSNNSSINKLVPMTIVESFKTLRRTTTSQDETGPSIHDNPSDTIGGSQLRRTTKINKTTEQSERFKDYIKSTKTNKKRSKCPQKKRTLYSHDSDEDEDENISPQTSIASSSQKTSSAEVIFEHPNPNWVSAESNTDSDAQNFRKPYKPGPLKTKKMTQIVDPSTISSEQSSDDNTEIHETPKSSRPSTHKAHLQEAHTNKKRQVVEERQTSDSEFEEPERATRKAHQNRKKTEKEKKVSEPSNKSRVRPKKISSNNHHVSSDITSDEPTVHSESPKKSRKRKEVIPHNELACDDVSESDNQIVNKKLEPQKKVKKTKKQATEKEDRHAVDKLKKRKKPDLSATDEEQMPRRRRIIEKNDGDEGFDESIDNDFDVIYIPDNDRYSLRKRRLCRPWWIPTAPSNLRITFDSLTKADVKAEMQIKEIQKRTGIKPKNPWNGSNAFPQAPADVLKAMKQLEKQKKQTSKDANKKKPQISSESEHETDNESVQTNVSVQTTQSSIAPSEAIYKAFQDLSSSSGVGRVVTRNPDFDTAQFDSIEWVVCNDGIQFYGFLGNGGDGLMKLLPGSVKEKSRTKSSILKFMILCGEVNFIINEQPNIIRSFGYVNIHRGQRYEIKNQSDREVIIAFTRMNENDFVGKGTNSKS